jgi:FixJ family two-component response regulator
MNDISIIGVSAYGNQSLSAKFIKAGANDFLTKQFLNEEFFSVK